MPELAEVFVCPHCALSQLGADVAAFDLTAGDEVAGWFRAAGFDDVTVLGTPPGTIKVRGTKA